MNKFCLGICEFFQSQLHGYNNNSTPNIENYLIINTTIDLIDFWNNKYKQYLENLLHYNYYSFNYDHIINYNSNTFNNIDCLKINIIEIIELPGLEQVACIKTIWLKILQRKWKKMCKDRKDKIQKLKNPYILRKRELTGRV